MNVLYLRFSLVASLMDPWGLLMQTCWPPLSDHWSVQPTSPHLSGFVFYGCLSALWPFMRLHINWNLFDICIYASRKWDIIKWWCLINHRRRNNHQRKNHKYRNLLPFCPWGDELIDMFPLFGIVISCNYAALIQISVSFLVLTNKTTMS